MPIEHNGVDPCSSDDEEDAERRKRGDLTWSASSGVHDASFKKRPPKAPPGEENSSPVSRTTRELGMVSLASNAASTAPTFKLTSDAKSKMGELGQLAGKR